MSVYVVSEEISVSTCFPLTPLSRQISRNLAGASFNM